MRWAGSAVTSSLSVLPDARRARSRQLKALAERVLLAARTPFCSSGQEMTVSASVGISVFPDNGWTGAELMRSADAAMYRSKKNGRNG